MRPTVGRIVHYVSYGTPPREDGTQAYKSQCRAAIITEVGSPMQRPQDGSVVDSVSVCVLNPTGQFFNTEVLYDEGTAAGEHDGGTWHWPERVDE
jgi:hypothetical protein